MKKCLVLLLVGFFSFNDPATGQPYYFTHYQVENGLSNNAVMCSLQDHQGFMWFGTRDGLNRFDGLSFKIFRNSPDDPKSIGSNAINSIYEDQSMRLWIGAEKGLFSYDGKTESFTQLKVAGNTSIREVKVTGSNIWYIALYTLYSFNEKTGKLKTYRFNKEVTSYCFIKDGTLWISTSTGSIGRYDAIHDCFIEYDVFNKSPDAVSRWIESIFDTGTGTLLVGTSNQGLKSFDIRSATYKDVLTFNTDKTAIIVRDILSITNNQYWIATQSGIYILDIITGKYLQLTRQYEDPYSLSDNIVHTLCRDKEGGIWAGTYFGGLNYYPKPYITFKKYFPMSCMNSISGNAVREICNDGDNNLWIGTEDAGLNKLDPVTGYFINFTPENNKKSVSYSNIHGLLVYKDEVWAGTYLHGLDVLSVKTGRRLRSYTTETSSIGSNFIYSIFKTGSDQIIAATDKGLFQYMPDKNDFKLLKLGPSVFYRTLCEDRNGTLWAGSYGDGVFYYNSKTGSHGQYISEPGNPSSLASNLVNRIFEDSGGNIWFATEGGLCKYQGISHSFKRFTKNNGFPSDVIYAVLEDAKKNLWVSTSKGLVCFSPATQAIKIYTKSHGLLTDQFNYSSGYKAKNGQMYFGSVKGLITFHPDSIVSDAFSPPVFITGFQVYNKELQIGGKEATLQTSIINTKQVTLSYNQSSFSIDFAALSYTAPNMNKYAYIMEGLEKDWTYLETNRKVYFTELNPGNYTFKIKAEKDGANGYGQPAILQITILPPVWKTWWAYTLYSITIVLTAYAILRLIINRAKEKTNRKLEKMEYDKERENYKDKMDFFTNVAHEIKTPLTLIKGPMENIMDLADEAPFIRNSLEIMNKNTDRLLYLSNQLLDFRKIEMNGFRLNYSKENISRLLKEQYQNYKVVAEQKKIHVALDIPENFYAFIDMEAFNKILSNLWDNAIKYAHSKVAVSLTTSFNKKEMYCLSFKNDGYIIPSELRDKIFDSFYRVKETNKLPGTGIGLTLSRSLTEMHGGTLKLNIEEKEMNDFVLTFPLEPK